MNRRHLALPIVAAIVALAGSRLLADDGDVPPEPVFPTVVAETSSGWHDDDWAVDRFVDDPFDSSRLTDRD